VDLAAMGAPRGLGRLAEASAPVEKKRRGENIFPPLLTLTEQILASETNASQGAASAIETCHY
jgi:hypothetical protein